MVVINEKINRTPNFFYGNRGVQPSDTGDFSGLGLSAAWFGYHVRGLVFGPGNPSDVSANGFRTVGAN